MHLSAKITKFLRSNVSLSVDGIAMQKYRIYCIASGDIQTLKILEYVKTKRQFDVQF